MHGFLKDGADWISIDSPFAANYTVITGINDSGQIVGFSFDGGDHAFEASPTPVPEPSGSALLGAGAMLLAVAARRVTSGSCGLRRRPSGW